MDKQTALQRIVDLTENAGSDFEVSRKANELIPKTEGATKIELSVTANCAATRAVIQTCAAAILEALVT